MRFLITGDLHLGRRSTRIPERVPDASTAAVWARAVDVALAHDVDAVLLSGDLVDQDNRYFEALGPLERGLRRLRSAGIRAVAVAGNHDHATLPALVASLPADTLTLLGAGGRWEQVTLTARHNHARAHVLGWSFPSRTVRESPLASLPAFVSDGVPTIGLLHGDLDVPTSEYTPLASSELARTPMCAWVLGHIHAGGLRAAAPPVLYPGSPQPLDPGEPGVHGVWLGELADDGTFRVRLVPLSSVQYDTVTVDLLGCHDLASARTRVVAALRLKASHNARDELHHLALRVRFTGRSAVHGRLEPLAQQLRDAPMLALEDDGDAFDQDVAFDANGGAPCTISVTHVHDATTPDHDLEALTTGTDAIAVLAAWRRALGQHGLTALPDALRDTLHRIPSAVAGARVFSGTTNATLSDDALAELVRTQIDRLLDTLLAQRNGSGPEHAA